MADFGIVPVMEINCEAPMSTLYTELDEQEQRVTAGTPGSGISTGIPKVEVSMANAKKVGRVIAAYYGTVPNGFLATVVGLHVDAAKTATAAKTFRRMKSDLFVEKFGTGSFIYKFARGKVSTSDFLTYQHNFAIEARICDFAVANEDEGAITRRAAKRQAILDATASSEQVWVDTYTVAFNKAKKAHEKARGVGKVRLARTRDLCEELMANPPRCAVDVTTLLNRRACEQAKMIPLLLRTMDERVRFWFDHVTKDTIASHLGAAMSVVDIRRMCIDEVANPPDVIPPFHTIVGNVFALSCELLHRLIVAPEDSKRLQLLLNDRSLRMASVDMSGDLSPECFDQIRGLRNSLDFEAAENGSWKDIPVLVPETRGKKRSAPEEDGRNTN
ncbi:uncharacterized protein J4E79_004323 [Alternaria viburni]|uniref:uncharacterized protein n=1 Tax=Alternaria viburni TaxID=566460 RepID=UPI0020C50640|nr:uncharacterized protein J4E79_004323 [Alternaria viburni]KAI4663011.1 hypothetical protein J4E79_004323 [Alternaria viburni]